MQNDFSRRATLAAIVSLAWPTVLEQIFQTAVSYVDSAMVGRVGAHATAAVGATMTVQWLLGGIIASLGIGFLTYISREIGAKRPENARHAVSQITLITLVLGIVLTVIPLALAGNIARWMHASEDILEDATRYFFILYIPMLFRTASVLYSTCLRAAGDTRTPLRVNLMVNLINICLNYLLIYPSHTVTLLGITLRIPGAGLEVTGAAIATAVSIAAGGIGMSVAVLRHPMLSPVGLPLKPDAAVLKPCLKISLPYALQRLGTSFGYVTFASMINSLGTVSLAAHSIANTAESAFYIPGYGMQTAASTLIGNCWGARNKERMKQMCRMLILLEITLMCITGGILFLSAEKLMHIFTQDNEVIALGSRVLRMVAVSEPIYGVAIIVEGILRGVGETTYPFFFNLACMWGVRILGTFITVKHFGLGLTAAWGSMIAHNALLGILLFIRYRTGKWNPLLKDSGDKA